MATGIGDKTLLAGLSRLAGKRVLVIGNPEAYALQGLAESTLSLDVWNVSEDSPEVRNLDISLPWLTSPPSNIDAVVLWCVLDRTPEPVALLRWTSLVAPLILIDSEVVPVDERMFIHDNCKRNRLFLHQFSLEWLRHEMGRLNYSVRVLPLPDFGSTITGRRNRSLVDSVGPVASRRAEEDYKTKRCLLAAERMDTFGSERPVLVHVHVPKSGGSSVKLLLGESFGTNHGAMYIGDPQRSHTAYTLKEALYRFPNLIALSSHSFREFPPMIGRRILLYMCFVRDPVHWHLSLYRYLRKKWVTSITPEQKSTLPTDFTQLTMPMFFAWQDREDQRLGITPNRQVQYFARSNNLDLAKSILEDFFFVGVTEQMDRSIELLRRKLKPYGISLSETKINHENNTEELYRETADLQSAPEVRGYFNQLSTDYELYHWASERLEREACQYGVG